MIRFTMSCASTSAWVRWKASNSVVSILVCNPASPSKPMARIRMVTKISIRLKPACADILRLSGGMSFLSLVIACS
ncbi:hypothetical protein D3C72_2247090 [compost metagenome]